MPDPVREFLTELTREPYADSDPASLLSWVRGRAAAVLAEMDNREPADLRRVREALELAQKWLANSMPVVEIAGPKPLPAVSAALASLDAVAQRLADLEADKARLDWLDMHPGRIEYALLRRTVFVKDSNTNKYYETLRAAIDAAREGK